tara:strand:- start:396 stop:1634 length:1239 start_codon:yes stop_codon:yes gene_type:complete
MKSSYDWIVIGGGISGIAISEILTRENKSVLLLEKNSELASETSKDFHEWVHSGALYTLVPDNLLTLRYLLGATDDLIEYYSSFPKMNLLAGENGINIKKRGWFNNDRIEFRYKAHKLNPVWLSMVSRSISIIELLKKHDWLRRRAGSEYGSSKVKTSYRFSKIVELLNNKENFYSIESPDFTMNSRELLKDILLNATNNGLEYFLNTEVKSVKELENCVQVSGNGNNYLSKNVVITSPDAISKFYKIPIKESYAPMSIVEGVRDNEGSFVELDYYVKKCINLLKKDNGIGQIGGITLQKMSQVESYHNYLISEHQKRNPNLKVLDSYVGIKKELVSNTQDRNYLYHINQNSSNVYSVILGKFTLAFSMAPEFYRRIYKKNPKKYFEFKNDIEHQSVVSNSAWQEIAYRERR